jgi:hypothetical protein
MEAPKAKISNKKLAFQLVPLISSPCITRRFV